MAWKYVNGGVCLFYCQLDTVLTLMKPILLSQSILEAQLKQHFCQNHVARMEDPVWFALRNTTYATSRRYLLANSTSITFQHAEATSWLLFCNALSVIGEMIVSHSGMTAIQALTIMVSPPTPLYDLYDFSNLSATDISCYGTRRTVC